MRQTRQIITAITAAMLVTTILFTGAAVAQAPGEPVNFYGSIEDADGQPAPEGTEVFAVINGSVQSSLEVSPTGEYGGSGAFDDKLAVNPAVGDTVIFRVGSSTGPQASETVSLASVDDGVVQQNITFPSGTFASQSDTPAGGGAGGGGAGGGAEDAPPSIQEIRSTLNLVQPSTNTETQIQDADPDTPGTSVTLEGTESVRSINFDSEGITGSVQVREYSNPPETVRTQVADSITGSGALGGGDSAGGDGTGESDSTDSSGASVNVISVSDITPTSEEAEDSSATVELSVPASEVENPNQVTVVKETYDFELQQDTWSQLETTVENVGEEEITVSARAESFSLFAVAEVDQGDGAQQVEDGQQDDQPGEGLSPTTIVLGILAILVVGGFLIYVRNTDS